MIQRDTDVDLEEEKVEKTDRDEYDSRVDITNPFLKD